MNQAESSQTEGAGSSRAVRVVQPLRYCQRGFGSPPDSQLPLPRLCPGRAPGEQQIATLCQLARLQLLVQLEGPLPMACCLLVGVDRKCLLRGQPAVLQGFMLFGGVLAPAAEVVC